MQDYESCNLGPLPPNFVVTSANQNVDRYLQLSQTLVRLADLFGGRARHSFRLFGAYKGASNLMFGDAAVAIQPLPLKTDYRQALGHHLSALEDSDVRVCNGSKLLFSVNSFVSLLLLIIVNHLLF